MVPLSRRPQLLEALNAGTIDLGRTGEAPPIFAQAAGVPVVYIGNQPPFPDGEGILVPKDSPTRSVADLKGKKIALNKGSTVHYLLLIALAEADLKYQDIHPAYLPPAGAQAAFQGGSVDAWAIWDPFLTAAEVATGARILLDGSNLVANREFFLRNSCDTRNPRSPMVRRNYEFPVLKLKNDPILRNSFNFVWNFLTIPLSMD